MTMGAKNREIPIEQPTPITKEMIKEFKKIFVPEVHQKIYDKISEILTRYESEPFKERNNLLSEEMYDLLVEIQNNWEDVITADD